MLIKNGLVFRESGFEHADIRVKDGRFTELAPNGSLSPEQGEEVMDVQGMRILPGLVDVHSHGRTGEDFSFVTEETVQKLCLSYAECGVTAVLGTTMTNDPATVEASIAAMGRYRGEGGAKFLGIHMEGPFLGKDKKGAHDEAYLCEPDKKWVDKLQNLSNHQIRLITVDPCLPGASEFISACKEDGIFVSLGHTSCDYDTALQAADYGADHVTHLFNAMNPLLHRAPGLIGAAADKGMYMELICDGIHVHPSLIRLMFAAGAEQMLLISDSMQAAGLSDGEYELGGLQVFVKEGKATLADGTIAGSTTNVYDAMVNVIRFGVPAEQAIRSASYLPAKSIGMEDKVGSIRPGAAADFLVVADDWKLCHVYIDGKCIK